jgi:hypothetical protein
MRFSDMMGSGDDRSAPGEAGGDTAVVDALTPYINAPDADSPVESTDAGETVENVAVETVVAEPAAFVPVATFEPASTFEPAAFEPAPSEPVAAVFADFTPLSDDLLPRKR